VRDGRPSDELTLDDLVIRSSSHTPFFGVYLASHAISDALCMCHASVGCKVKTELHLCDHDGIADAHNRRRYSQFIDEDLISGSTEQLEDEIRAWQARQKSGVVLIDASTPISLQAQDMRPVIRRMEERTGADVVHVPARNYDDDLWGGYAKTIGALLKRQRWPEDDDEVADDEVSVIGYPFDRYEADHQGNVTELRRLLWALGLKARSVLFAGEDYQTLKRVTRARSHLLLPWAHSQSKVLRKLKRDHLRTVMPMGLGGTRRWLEQIGGHLNVDPRRIERAISAETDRIKPMMELARRKLSGRRFAIFAEAPRAAGLLGTLLEVGMVPVTVGVLHFSLGGRKAVEKMLRQWFDVEVPGFTQWLEDPTPAEVSALVPEMETGTVYRNRDTARHSVDSVGPAGREVGFGDAQVAIGTTIERELLADAQVPWVEHGYPSEGRHYLFPAPWLGYNGTLRLLEQVMMGLEQVGRGGGRR